ncbi:MAG: hypothetical protein WDO15_17545 [Bacteroidota bacterium]
MIKVLAIVSVMVFLTFEPNRPVDNSVPALTQKSKDLPLNLVKLPKGFSIAIYAEVPDARSMALSPSGTLFVGNRDGDKVYAVQAATSKETKFL